MYWHGFCGCVLSSWTVSQNESLVCSWRWRFSLIFKLNDLAQNGHLYMTTLWRFDVSECMLILELSWLGFVLESNVLKVSVNIVDTSTISSSSGSGSGSTGDAAAAAGDVVCVSRTCPSSCSASLKVSSQKAHCIKQDSWIVFVVSSVSVVCIDLNLSASSSSRSVKIKIQNKRTISYMYIKG